MKVLYIAAECKPYSKMGGVADVAGELPAAMKAKGIDVTVVTPLYKSVDVKRHGLKAAGKYEVKSAGMTEEVALYKGISHGNVPVIFVRNKTYLDEGPYVHSIHFPFKDDSIRFYFLCQAVQPLITEDVDIVHANDWMSGYLFSLMAADGMKQKRVMTVHNISYQGNLYVPNILGWDMDFLLQSKYAEMFTDLQYFNNVNPMRLGLELCDIANAVSPTYAEEILKPGDQGRFFEGGKGLETVCQRLNAEGRLIGILNGIRYESVPSEDSFKKMLQEKEKFKKRLSCYFKSPENALFGIVGRACEQKFRLFAEEIDGKPVLEHLLEISGVNIVVSSGGQAEYQSFMANMTMQRYKGFCDYGSALRQQKRMNYAAFTGFDREMTVRINNGSDIFLMPSLFEPCGITQMESMLSGTPPLVRNTGGLADTVIDHSLPGGNGFVFDGMTRDELLRNLVSKVHEASKTCKHKSHFKEIQRNAFFKRFTWEDSAEKYAEMYEKVMRR